MSSKNEAYGGADSVPHDSNCGTVEWMRCRSASLERIFIEPNHKTCFTCEAFVMSDKPAFLLQLSFRTRNFSDAAADVFCRF